MATRLSDWGFVEALFRKNESDLKSFVQRRLGSGGPVDVDDIVQEAFLRIATQSEPELIDNPRGFLFRIARNLTFDALRRSKVRRLYAEEHAAEHASGIRAAETGSAESEASAREDLELICDAIDDLPAQCRRVFLLQRREGLSYARIAERLGISESMVQKHMSRALAKLYRVLP